MSFDTLIPRRNTNSMKWDSLQTVFGAEHVLPLWVADMDFAVAPAISDAVQARAAHAVYGYGIQSESLYHSVIQWFQQRHGWAIQRDWILTAPGVVPSMSLAVHALTDPGDGVIIQSPVYPPFYSCVNDNGRQLVDNTLTHKNGYYEIDFDLLTEQAKQPRNKLLLLCTPHNPVGRVWKRGELERLSFICQENGVLVVSDEIHCDLVFSKHRHIPFASLNDAALKNSITCISPSKTFNIAGLNTSFVVAADTEVRRKMRQALERLHVTRLNVFGTIAAEAAYSHGGSWLNELLDYLENNAVLIADFVENNLPGVKYIPPEGTYLGWLDFREHFTSSPELKQFLVQKAKVGLNDGLSFGKSGEGFARINFGCPKAMLQEGLQNIAAAFASR
jgi:cystathionine beta-lyase